MSDFRILLISTYDLGRQPFGLASAASWLRNAGFDVRCQDLSQEAMDKDAAAESALIAFYLPMHTATRIGLRAIERARQAAPNAHLCAFGLYAPMNADYLHKIGVTTILGGEFEEGLLSLARRLQKNPDGPQIEPLISLAKQNFLVPDRAGLPPLKKYARLSLPDGSSRMVGATEASRGCKHLCRHCPIVPVYNGAFRIVQREVVLEDVRRQVDAGAQHITFGDPDFFNGVTHGTELVRALHREFPRVSYDVTIKVEHLLKHARLLPLLRDTGCAFVTTAVESLDDRVLQIFDKNHTRADFYRVVELFREAGLTLAPTFVAFHPWTTLESHREFLSTLAELELVEHVPPIQLGIRLLIPAGSRLLELPEVRGVAGEFDEAALSYRWKHRDPAVDLLQRETEQMATFVSKLEGGRTFAYERAWELLHRMLEHSDALPEPPPFAARATIPYLTEPWYC